MIIPEPGTPAVPIDAKVAVKPIVIISASVNFGKVIYMRIIKGDNATKFEEFINESKRHCFAFYILLNIQGDEFYSKYENEISLIDSFLHCLKFMAWVQALLFKIIEISNNRKVGQYFK
jgi:hypothetical protein